MLIFQQVTYYYEVQCRYSVYYHNIGAIGTKEVTMTDMAIQCTTHDNTSGNVHVQSIIAYSYMLYVHVHLH